MASGSCAICHYRSHLHRSRLGLRYHSSLTPYSAISGSVFPCHSAVFMPPSLFYIRSLNTVYHASTHKWDLSSIGQNKKSKVTSTPMKNAPTIQEQPVVSPSSSNLELATAKVSLKHFLNMNLSTLRAMEKATILLAMSILKNSPDFPQLSMHGVLDGLPSMFTVFQETLIHLGNIQVKKKRLNDMITKIKTVLATSHQKNQDLDAKEELVKRLELELIQHKSDMVAFLPDSEVLKVPHANLRPIFNTSGDELNSQKQTYQQLEDALTVAKHTWAVCHSKWEELQSLDLS